MTNDNKLPVEVATMQPQAPPPPNEVFIRVAQPYTRWLTNLLSMEGR